ncbi:MAG: hypothetical protein IKT67_08785 [Lachnospiraceae bacterium]|nr:hypothetical protein [Lachnospiraceae bacterium]
MDKNEERARQMYDRGESPYGWTEKEKIENTQSMVNGQGETISAADAKDINEKYALNKSSWDTERIEAEIRETEEYIYERREEQAYQNFLDAFLSFRGAERCEEKIAEIKEAIYKAWATYKNGKKEYVLGMWFPFEGTNRKSGMHIDSYIRIGDAIERINSLVYMLSTYRINIEAYKIYDLPYGESIDNDFLTKQRKTEVEAGLASLWRGAVEPKAFDYYHSVSSAFSLYTHNSINTNTLENVYEKFVNRYLNSEYRYSIEEIVGKIRSAIWRAVCIQEREYEYRGSDEWHRYKDRLWDSTIPISDEVIFILQYYVCCYEFIKERLYKGVDSVEKIVKNGRNDERYPLDMLEKKFAGKVFPQQMFNDMRMGQECSAGVRTNILTLIFAFFCAVGAGVLLKEFGLMDRILVMITVFSAIHVLVTTGTTAHKFFLKIRIVNFLVSSISSGILYWKSFSFICDLAKRTVPLGARYLFCLACVMLFYIIFGGFFWGLKEATRKMEYNQSEDLRSAIVRHWLINLITIIVYSIFS